METTLSSEPIVKGVTEQDIENLLRKQPEALKKAEEYQRSLSKEEWHRLRILAKKDRFFLASVILGYDRLSVNLHGHCCKWLDANRYAKYILFLMPRAHFKSTIETISGNIARALPDDAGDEQYPWNLGSDIRILICHAIEKKANEFLYSITGHFTTNPMLMGLFPELVPNPRIQKINTSQLELPRTKIWSEPTFSTSGNSGSNQGPHYDHQDFDDITGEKERESPTENESVKLFFDSTPGLRVYLGKSTFIMPGTRWGPDDIYDHVMQRYGDQLKIYRRAVEEYVVEEEPVTKKLIKVKKPIFPEEIETKDLEVLKKNKRVYTAQYENDPAGGDLKWQESWIRQYLWVNDTQVAIPKVGSIGLERTVSLWSMYRCLLLDPATSGDSGWAVTGTDSVNCNFVLEAIQKDLNVPAIMDLIFEMQRKYQLHAIAIEEVLFSELFRHWAEREQILRQQSVNIVPVTTKQKAKGVRVDGLSTYLSSGQLLFNDTRYSKGQNKLDVNESDLLYQIRKYGVLPETQIHLLDALAYGKDVWMPGYDQRAIEEAKKKEQERIKNSSYGKINYSTGR
jgi:hypothetical protein